MPTTPSHNPTPSLPSPLNPPSQNAEAYNNMKLRPDYSHLAGKHAPTECMLPLWGGTFDFDLDEYVEWRAKEEGVEVCPRGQGRRFDPSATGDEDAMSVTGVSAAELLLDEAEPVAKQGSCSKQGSGRGIFGNRKWKTKLLVVARGFVFYFDKLDVTEANKAARTVPLGVGCSVAKADGDAAGFVLTTPARNYTFSAGSAAECDEWVETIGAEIEAAEAMAKGMAEKPPKEGAELDAGGAAEVVA